MRYRALGRSGQAISALTLTLDEATPRELRATLACAALEAGINAFDIGGSDPSLLDDVGPVLAGVERHLIYVSVRLGIARDRNGEPVRDFGAERLVRVIEGCATRMKLGHLDIALLDEPAAPELPTRTLAALKATRDQGRARWLGVSGDGEAMDAYLSNGAFDVLVTPYNLTSGWQVRNRLKTAGQSDMSVIGCASFPDSLRRKPAGAAAGGFLSRLLGGKPKPARVAAGVGYGFLEHTLDWTAEEICLAYALTEPGLATVAVAPRSVEALEALAKVPEREMPSNLPAQIEMARFTSAAAA